MFCRPSAPVFMRANRASAVARIAIICALAVTLAPSCAHADVRRTDMIVGASVDERALSASVCPSIAAEHAILVDAEGDVFFERDAQAEANIASITKVMTAIIALESAPLDTSITVSALAAGVGESSANLETGDVLSLGEALKALMIPSGNDAAIAIAESLGRSMANTEDDTQASNAFIAKMNEKAQELGCEDTLFENPHGLDFDTFSGNLHSTAEDVSKIVAYAMENDYFRSVVDTEEAFIPVQRHGQTVMVELVSTDELLGVYEGACGVKTGFTELAGACFAGACNRGNGDIYAIVLDSPSESQRFTDTTTLFDWYYSQHRSYSLANSDEMATMTVEGETREVPVVARVSVDGWPDRTVNATFATPDSSVEVFAPEGNISQEFTFYDTGSGVSVGEVVGKATFYQRNEIVAEQDIVACEDVAAPNILETIQIGWQRFTHLFTGERNTAEDEVLNSTPLLL